MHTYILSTFIHSCIHTTSTYYPLRTTHDPLTTTHCALPTTHTARRARHHAQAGFKAEAAAERRRLRRELETIDRVERKVTKGGRVAIGRYALEMANNNAKAKATAKPPDGPPPMVPMP